MIRYPISLSFKTQSKCPIEIFVTFDNDRFVSLDSILCTTNKASIDLDYINLKISEDIWVKTVNLNKALNFWMKEPPDLDITTDVFWRLIDPQGCKIRR